MQIIFAGVLAALIAAASQPVTEPGVKKTTIRAGHDIAPLPGGKVAPISQSDKDNINNAVDYFEKKLRPSRRKKKAAESAGAPAAASAPTVE